MRAAPSVGLLAALALLPVPALARPPAAAQSPRIRQHVVVTASLAPAELGSITRPVTILTREDLERLGVRAIADALRLVPGVDVRARGSHDVQTDFAIRGATFGQNLVLVDGIRLNDSQSGHHNGDIPVSPAGLERLEVVPGAGSAVHGADALGGTINVITRRDRHAALSAAAGQHGSVALETSSRGAVLPDRWTVSAWGSRSRGFMFDRDFAQGGLFVRGQPSAGWTVDGRHLRKAFGANGFYGPSPSKEWTDLTMAALGWQGAAGAWAVETRTSWRNHGDHFRWDINRPGFAENRHRTNAADAALLARRDLGGGRRLTVGGSGGGDWIRSSNLGDHAYGRGSGFAELQWTASERIAVQAGLRLDGYSTFGHAWSPSVSAGVRVARDLRLRAGAGHAFRIPTFTERFYRDPAHEARAGLVAERGWSFEGGADWMPGAWALSVTPFRRRDRDVIDWIRDSPAERWRTTNVRDVTVSGVEAGLTRRWRTALLRAGFTGLRVEAPALDVLSKYVLEYARRSLVVSVAGPIGGGVDAAVSVDHRARADGQSYALVTARLSRPIGRAVVSLDATNLLDETYREIAGVAMPGRWVTVGVLLR